MKFLMEYHLGGCHVTNLQEENKAVVRRFFEAFNQKNPDICDEVVALSAVNHSIPIPPGREHWKQANRMFINAFPDGQQTVDDQVAEGDKVVTRWTVRGTHQGNFLNIPPTGKSVTFSGILIDKIVEGQIAECDAAAGSDPCCRVQ
jgi:predicted ester cyclase